MDFYHTLGYLTGLFFVKPGMEPTTLFRTAALVHILDAALCAVIAGQSGRRKTLWMIAGLVFGVWALSALCLLPAQRRGD